MGTVSQKLEYLNTTKSHLKDMINLTGAGITSETTFRNYASKLYDGYVEVLKDKYMLLDAMPKGIATGTNATISDAVDLPVYNLKMDKESTQDGEPSPDYPQEVNTVKGYRNLFDKDNANVLDAFFNAGNIQEQISGQKTIYIPCKPNTTYTVTKTAGQRFQVAYANTEPAINSTVLGTQVNNNGTKITITTGSEAQYLASFCYAGSDTITFQQMLDSIMITETAEEMPYVPYGNNYINVSVTGKNLFDANLFEAFTSTIKYLTLQLKPNTNYTMSSNIPVTTGVGANLFFMKDNETASTGTNDIRPNLSRTLTTDSTGIVKIGYRNAGGLDANPQTAYWYLIEESSTATEYKAYQNNNYPIPLNNNELVGIGNYKDELLIDKSGNVYINKKTGKQVFVGSDDEGWAISETSQSGSNRFLTLLISDYVLRPANNNTLAPMFSNYFIGKTANQTYLNQEGLSISQTGSMHIYTNDFKSYTVAQFQTWLSTHNTDVYYVLATPELIDLNTTIDVTLFEGINNISNSEDANMQIRYVKNNEL